MACHKFEKYVLYCTVPQYTVGRRAITKNVDDDESSERGGTSEHYPCTAALIYKKIKIRSILALGKGKIETKRLRC